MGANRENFGGYHDCLKFGGYHDCLISWLLETFHKFSRKFSANSVICKRVSRSLLDFHNSISNCRNFSNANGGYHKNYPSLPPRNLNRV